MAHCPNITYNKNCGEIKQEFGSDDNEQTIPIDAAIHGAKQEENCKKQVYKDELYTGHYIKEELVIGPEVLQQPDVVATSHGTNTGGPCSRVLQSDPRDVGIEKTGKSDEEIADHKTIQPAIIKKSEKLGLQCNIAFEDANTEKQERKKHVKNTSKTKKLSFDNFGDSKIAESLNPFEGNTEDYIINCELNQISYSYSKCEKVPDFSESFQKQSESHDSSQQLQVHSKHNTYVCSYCQHKFSCNSKLKVHLRVHTGEKPYYCTYCKYSCSQKSHLIRHVRKHTGEKPYSCTYCKDSFSESSGLKKHLRTHTGEKPYSCTYCQYRCCSNSRLRIHLRRHTDKYSCSEKNRLRKNTKDGSSTQFACDSSGFKFNDLQIHIKAHSKERSYVCSYCEHKFSCSSNLKVHIRKHTGEKPYRCTYCQYSCSQRGNLRTHLRTHTGEKPYHCIHCRYSSNQKINLIHHLKKHTNTNPVICTSVYAKEETD